MKTITKYDSTKHEQYSKNLPFSYVSTVIYLDFAAYCLTVNNERLIVTQDPVFHHDFPSLFLPTKKENWEHCSISMASENDIKKIKETQIEIATTNPTEVEYFYKTENIINPKKSIREEISRFEKKYRYDIKKTFEKKAIQRFMKSWSAQKNEHDDNPFFFESNLFFQYCLQNLQRYDIQQVYVTIDNKLAGFTWGVVHSRNKWVSIHSKIDYQFKGLNQFLRKELARYFPMESEVSLGTGCHSPGLTAYKEKLEPSRTQQYHYILTRGKKK